MTDPSAKYLTSDDANNPELQNLEQVNRPPITTSAGQPPDVRDRYQGGVVSALGLQPDIVESQLPGSSPVYRLMPASNAGNPQTNAAIQSTAQTVANSTVSGSVVISLTIPGIFTPITQTANKSPYNLSFALALEPANTVFRAGNAGGGGSYDVVSSQAGISSTPISISATPNNDNEFAFYVSATDGAGSNTPNPGAGWTLVTPNSSFGLYLSAYTQFLTSTSTVSISGSSIGVDFCSALGLFGTSGIPALAQPGVALNHVAWMATLSPGAFALSNTAGNAIIVAVGANSAVSFVTGAISVTDTQGNTYVLVGNFNNGGVGGSCQILLFVALNIKAGANTVTFNSTAGNADISIGAFEFTNVVSISTLPFFGPLTGPFIPPIDLSLVGVNGGIMNTLGVGNGGTGLTAPGPSGNVLTSNGTIWTSAAPTGAFYQTVQQAGTSRTQRPKLNFLAPITATDNAGNTSTDIAVPNMVGDSGAGGTNGLVPAPGAGDAAAGKFLKADATWAVPSGGSGFAGGVNSQTGDYTILSTDSQAIVSLASGSHTFKLPAAIPAATFVVFVENVGSGTLTLNPNGLNLDGSASNVSIAQNQGMYIATDGANYFSMRGWSTGGGGGVSSLNSLTGALSLTSTGATITITPSGSTINLESTGGGGGAKAGGNITPIFPPTTNDGNDKGETIIIKIPAWAVQAGSNTVQLIMRLDASSATGNAIFGAIVIKRTLPGSTTVIDTTPFSVGSNFAPTIAVVNGSATVITTDAISFTFDAFHDYYVEAFISNSSTASTVIPASSVASPMTQNTANQNVTSDGVSGDHTGDTTISFSPGAGTILFFQVIAAS